MKRLVDIVGAGLIVATAGIATVQPAYAQSGAGPRGQWWAPFDGGWSEVGVSVRDLDKAEAERQKVQGGALIEDVRPGSAAEKAGVKKGDVVVEFDGERVRSARQLTRLVHETPPGKTVKATIVRDGRRSDVSLAASERRLDALVDGRLRDRLGRLDIRPFDFELPGASTPRLGVTVQELTPQLAGYFGAKEGVLITSVVEDSPASRAGLKAGDVIVSFEGRAVASQGDLIRAVRDGRAGEDVTIGIVRDKKESSLKAKIEERRPVRRPSTRAIRSV